MKLTIQYHAGNPNMCRIPELSIRQMPECEGGGWWMPRGQAEDLLSVAATGTVLTEEMEQAGFDALDEYAVMKAHGVFPRPSLIAHLWNCMADAAPECPITSRERYLIEALRLAADRLDEEGSPKFMAEDARNVIATVEQRSKPPHSAPDGEGLSHPECQRCNGTGWLEPIGPCADGSYITSRPCSCRNGGHEFD